MARRIMSLIPQWSSRVFSVELDGAPVYFALQEGRRGEDAPQMFRDMHDRDRCYSLLVCSSDRIARAKFHGELKDSLLRCLPADCDLSPMSSFLPNVRDSLIKGYFLKASRDSSLPTERVLRDLTQHEPLLVCSYSKCAHDQQWTQNLWPHTGSNATPKEAYVVPSQAPEYHPSTLNIINSDVFYSFEEAYEVLKKVIICSLCSPQTCFYINIETSANVRPRVEGCDITACSNWLKALYFFHLSCCQLANSSVCVHAHHSL